MPRQNGGLIVAQFSLSSFSLSTEGLHSSKEYLIFEGEGDKHRSTKKRSNFESIRGPHGGTESAKMKGKPPIVKTKTRSHFKIKIGIPSTLITDTDSCISVSQTVVDTQ